MRALLTVFLLAAFLASPIASAESPDQPVDLNRATVAELVRLPGIGPTRAAAIVKRRKRRPFRRRRDLMRVRGIGRKLYKRLEPLVTVGKPIRRAS